MACSTAKAIEWDVQRSKNLDPSGRAALRVHVLAYEAHAPASLAAGSVPAMIKSKKPRMVEVAARHHVMLVCCICKERKL